MFKQSLLARAEIIIMYARICLAFGMSGIARLWESCQQWIKNIICCDENEFHLSNTLI